MRREGLLMESFERKLSLYSPNSCLNFWKNDENGGQWGLIKTKISFFLSWREIFELPPAPLFNMIEPLISSFFDH